VRRAAWSAFAVGAAAVLLLVTWRWGTVLARSTRIGLGAPPLHGAWMPRAAVGTIVATAVGGAVVAFGPTVARSLPWRFVPRVVAVTGATWAVALAAVDGRRGLTDGVTGRHEYIAAVGDVGTPLGFLASFVDYLQHGGPPDHVAGHPPGFVLVLWGLDRVGLGGGVPAAILCIAAGALALALVLVAVRAVAGERFARAAAPFVACSPAAVWIATTPDAVFAFSGAAAVTAFVLATDRDGAPARALAIVAGVAFGIALMLSYGMALVACIALAVAWQRRAAGLVALAGAAAGVVLLAVALTGFWWPDGFLATRDAYWDGIASTRPLRYFLLSNLAVLAVCIGPATVAALPWLRGPRVGVLVAGALAAVLLADLSGMSKGEVERIWLPFAIWMLPAAGIIATGRWSRPLLTAQVVTALAVQSLVRSG
jgi:hypothetical protein